MSAELSLNDEASLSSTPTPSLTPSSTSSLTPSTRRPELRRTGDLVYALIYEGESEARARAGETLLVLIPGAPSNERDFRHLAPLCARWSPVVRLLWPGFKERATSQDPSDPTADLTVDPTADLASMFFDADRAPASTAERMSYLKRVADAEGWSGCVALGHSMGGVAALAWAVEDERVMGLSMLSSVGVKRHRGMLMGPRAARLFCIFTRIPLIGALLSRLFDHLMGQMGFKRYRFDVRLTRLLMRYVAGVDFEENARFIERLRGRPTLKLSLTLTQDDPIVDREAGEALAKALLDARPDAEVTWLDEGGHNPQRYLTFEIDQQLRARYSELCREPEAH